jgi:hypothetical protein
MPLLGLACPSAQFDAVSLAIRKKSLSLEFSMWTSCRAFQKSLIVYIVKKEDWDLFDM